MINRVNVKLKDRNGATNSYYSKETITIPRAGSDEEVETFTAGQPLDNTKIELDFSTGDQFVDAPEGYVMRSGLINKPDDLEEIIAKGETFAGVAGEYVTPGTVKSVSTLDFASSDRYTVSVSGDERWGQVDIFKPAELISENIPVGISIAGIPGSYVPTGVSKSVELDFSSGDHQIIHTSAAELWNEIDIFKPSTLVPANIPEGVTIAGVSGTRVGLTLESVINKTLVTLIDDGLTYIPSVYFSGFSMLKMVSLANCSRIDSSAFYSCYALTEISIPNADYISYAAFASCSSLTSVYLSVPYTMFDYCFSNCQSLRTIDLTLCRYIGNYALTKAYQYDCIHNNTLTMPYCTYIGSKNFSDCDNLSIIAPLLKRVGSLFISTTNVYCVNSAYGIYYSDILISTTNTSFRNVSYGTRIIAPYAISGKNLGNGIISIPETIVTICDNAFARATNFRIDGTFPSLEYIGANAFNTCNYGVAISINAPILKKVDVSAFYSGNSYGIRSLNAPMLSSIGNGAFSSNSATFINCTLSSTIYYIGSCAFYKDFKLEFTNSVFTFGANDYYTIGPSAFYGCSKLSATFVFTGQTINQQAFYGCSLISTIVFESLGSSSTRGYIYSSAFTYCSNLMSIYIAQIPYFLSTYYPFANTPLITSGYTGSYAKIFVLSSLYSYIKTYAGWSSFSARMVSITEEQYQAFLSTLHLDEILSE